MLQYAEGIIIVHRCIGGIQQYLFVIFIIIAETHAVRPAQTRADRLEFPCNQLCKNHAGIMVGVSGRGRVTLKAVCTGVIAGVAMYG